MARKSEPELPRDFLAPAFEFREAVEVRRHAQVEGSPLRVCVLVRSGSVDFGTHRPVFPVSHRPTESVTASPRSCVRYRSRPGSALHGRLF